MFRPLFQKKQGDFLYAGKESAGLMDSTSYRRGLLTDKPTLYSAGEADNYHDRQQHSSCIYNKSKNGG